MNTDTRSRLPDQLRAIVDAVDTPTFADIRLHAVPPRTRTPRARVAFALAAVLLVVAAGVGIAALLETGDTSSRSKQPSPAVAPPDCGVTTGPHPGCDMAPRDASQFLGFDAHEATGLPEGWIALGARLLVYTDHIPNREGPLPPGFASIPIYVRAWGPPGTDLAATDDCAPSIVVRQRPAVPGEDPSQTGSPFALGNGTTAYGQEPFEGCYHGGLAWVRDGRSTIVEGNSVTLAQVVAVARSLDG